MRLSRFVLSLALLSPLVAALPACETTLLFQGNPEEATPAPEDWQVSDPIAAPSFDDLWYRTEATLDLMGLVPDSERSRPDKREIVTKWVTRLAPTRFEGYRRRAHIVFEPAGNDWVIRAAMIKQRNADIDDPSNPAQAQWEKAGADSSRTALLLYRIKSGFDPQSGAAAPGTAPAPAK